MSHGALAIGCAAGFSGDRTDAALPVVESLIARNVPSVLIFEMLAERTLALAQLERCKNPDRGYAPSLDAMVRPVIRRCAENGIPIVSNFGAANPRAAASVIRQIAKEQDVHNLRIAIVEGDDLSDEPSRVLLREYLPSAEQALVSANVYQGADAIAEALRAGAQIVVTGRVADPSLVVGPALAHFGWQEDDWDLIARATMAGHLLECGAQVTGGYFADPGFKEVPGLHNVGFPIAELSANGSFVITKAEPTGGVVNVRTVKEQLLYEMHNPSAYVTPDVIADISDAEVFEVSPNHVTVTGVRGYARPNTLKGLAFYAGGWLGEGEISYAGPNALARAQLAAKILKQRIGDVFPLRFDFIGSLSVFADDHGQAVERWKLATDNEIRLRVASSHYDHETIEGLLREVTALYTCGPAGGGGVRTTISQRLNSTAFFVPRTLVPASFTFLE